ncbi:hypothetical protein DGo_PB0239 (plasmid) [Deinococcus gobiensis I-0]|uniref:Uncharacterized protein n=1 Tax=Deinococcus gobiensis (strain DSM 21396 / JCM 16679 / CGMCC 1.7299 / I-0) TaxID=745776 RepID=H8H1W1_DEIGI|nr:hypothetical protein DGo_PB0239 [Deinococcus gobiensis I-0]
MPGTAVKGCGDRSGASSALAAAHDKRLSRRFRPGLRAGRAHERRRRCCTSGVLGPRHLEGRSGCCWSGRRSLDNGRPRRGSAGRATHDRCPRCWGRSRCGASCLTSPADQCCPGRCSTGCRPTCGTREGSRRASGRWRCRRQGARRRSGEGDDRSCALTGDDRGGRGPGRQGDGRCYGCGRDTNRLDRGLRRRTRRRGCWSGRNRRRRAVGGGVIGRCRRGCSLSGLDGCRRGLRGRSARAAAIRNDRFGCGRVLGALGDATGLGSRRHPRRRCVRRGGRGRGPGGGRRTAFVLRNEGRDQQERAEETYPANAERDGANLLGPPDALSLGLVHPRIEEALDTRTGALAEEFTRLLFILIGNGSVDLSCQFWLLLTDARQEGIELRRFRFRELKGRIKLCETGFEGGTGIRAIGHASACVRLG